MSQTPLTNALQSRFSQFREGDLAELWDHARAMEMAHASQQGNFIKLYEAVVGDGTFAGTPDAFEIARKLRTDADLVDYLCRLHGCDRKMVLHWCEFAVRKSL